MLFSFSARSAMYWTCFVCIKWKLQLPPNKGANHFKGIHESLSRPGLSIPLIPWKRLSRRTAKPTKWLAKWRLRSTWLSTQSDQSSLSARRNLGSVATIECTAKTLIRLGGCPGWSTSSPCVRIILFVLSCSGWIDLFPCCPKSKPSIPTFPVP